MRRELVGYVGLAINVMAVSADAFRPIAVAASDATSARDLAAQRMRALREKEGDSAEALEKTARGDRM